MSQAQVVALFNTGKTLLATFQAAIAAAQAAALACEQNRVQLIAAGGNASAAWLLLQAYQTGVGYVPLTVPGGPALTTVCAPDPAIARQTSLLGDQRGIAAYDPSLA